MTSDLGLASGGYGTHSGDHNGLEAISQATEQKRKALSTRPTYVDEKEDAWLRCVWVGGQAAEYGLRAECREVQSGVEN